MLHQTLILSSPPSFPPVSASPSSSPSSLLVPNDKTAAAAAATATTTAAMPSYAHHHSSLDERMDALKGSSRQEESPEEVAAAEAPAAWGFAEKDGFSVEDLLDLEEFCDGEADKDEHEDPPLPASAAAKQDGSYDACSQQSAVSFELAPPAPPAPEIVDLPAHDAEELEWVSRIMDDSLSELPPQPAPPAAMMASLAARPPQHRLLLQRRPQDGAYRALPMPSSDPLRTPTICALSTEALVPVKAKRSKRSRASAWSLSGAPHDSTSSSSTATTSSCSSSSASFSPYFLLDAAQFGASEMLLEEYNLLAPPPKKSKHGKGGGKPKKRGRKPKHLPPFHPSMSADAAPGDRRCSHCGVQKTPQWRAGPEGAKTLCNACGVRYKSGRLLPEYRPACSPTYVSSVHSNSHRKVLEMRRKKEDGPLILTAPGAAAAPAVPSF